MAIIDGTLDQGLAGSPRLVEAYHFFIGRLTEFLDRETLSDRLEHQPDASGRISAIFDTFRKDDGGGED